MSKLDVQKNSLIKILYKSFLSYNLYILVFLISLGFIIIPFIKYHYLNF